MPEGDTIHRAARRLGPELVGRPVRRWHVHRHRGPGLPEGSAVEAVDSVGKHLLVRFTAGWVLDSHLRMNGSWHLYRPGERWREPEGAMRAVVEVPERLAVLFSTPVVRLWHPRAPGPRPWERLGPDLCDPGPDLDAAVTRARWLPEGTELAEVLLDQRVAAGIGNVYKSEVCWAEEVDPRRRLGSLDDDILRRCYATAHRLLRRNLTRSRRVTYRTGVAVYGRDGRPCPRCGARIVRDRQGGLDRVTYRCPRCQI